MGEHWEVVRSGSIVVSNTPEELWESATKYFEWCRDNPIEKIITVPVGKYAGASYNEKKVRPFTVEGLCIHCGVTKEYLKSMRMIKGSDSMYYIVIERILSIIKTQNIEYAIVGDFNSIFVSKYLNIDKEEEPTSNIKVELIGNAPPLATSENEILNKLDSGLDGPESYEDEN